MGTGPPAWQGSAVGHSPSPARPSPTECRKVPGPRPCSVVGTEDQEALGGMLQEGKENSPE